MVVNLAASWADCTEPAARAMPPILPGLTMTRCRVHQRWESKAKPRSPWQRSEASSTLRGAVLMSSSRP